MKASFKYYLGFLSILLLSPFNSFGQTTILLHDLTELQDIGKQTHYLEDTSIKLSIEEVMGNSFEIKFKEYTQETLNFSSTASAYWLKFKITKAIPANFYLNVGSAYIDSISLYEFDKENKLISIRHTGDDLPFDTREIEVSNYLFALDFDVNSTRTFYLRVKSDQPLFFPLRVGTLSQFLNYEHDLDFLQGIYFGFMLLIFLYNLFLYFSTRERIYLYYIAYVFSITWFMASVFGYFFEYFWPNIPFLNGLVVVSAGLTMITATLFTQKFLNTKESGSIMHKGSMVFLFIGVLVCALVLLGFKIEGLKLAQGGLLIMAAYFILLGIRFRLKGYRPAKYYLLAWGALIIGICFAILESLNLTFVMTYLNAMQIGSALEVLLLSFALGDRINMYKKQKEDAQLEALLKAKENERLIQEQNVVLEKKVKERTAEVAIRNEELVNLNKEKDMLVNIAAHDLRTPLSHIRLLIQLIDITSLHLTEDQKSYLTEIDNSADRLSQMIGRILNIHALETNQVKLKNQVIDLVQLVNYVVKCFRLTAEDKEIEMITTSQSGNHYVEVDKNYMIQVLENLVSNAIKFSKRGSKVALHVKSHDARTYIVVEDHGPGISEQDQKKLFGRFQKLSAQPTEGEASIGLGLSIVKKYIESMNGEIHCESELGIGTKFIISFVSKEQLKKVKN
ncbi:signal transduction histidine kinase [Aquimarina sp. MAR_2010_214]|uniref:sensor histidine kinase n=1 Tax=Aquimarina sp. MAR_2010_214 TaxID=1250026 RepID=UPI000C6FF29C|nr:sensor histidine kinase [Aquimarina sp. MAR_2010_214]PKV51397.1 signal transduction histidine kinase [Aquimarina sp. MAR_2010_214]